MSDPYIHFITPDPEMYASQHHQIVTLICLPSIQVKKIIRTIICTNWHPSLLSHYHYPTDEYLHLTPVCITILSTLCKTNHLCIVYIIPGKNWHLVVLNFRFISYRPWVELSTASVVCGRQQRCGSGHFRELTWYSNDVHRIIIMLCTSPSCVMMIIVRLLNIWHIFSPFWPSLHRRERHG